MSTDQTEYDIFISYARRDNQPIPDTYPHGWVTSLHDHILADQRKFTTEPLRIFFDTKEIKDMDDWRYRILGGLRSSKILLICLSPNYFASEPCRWEWEEYLKRQTHQLMGMDSVATIYFAEVPGSSEQDNAKRLDQLLRGNFTDIRPWFPKGPESLKLADVRQKLDQLGTSLWERIERARRARSVPGNVRRTNPFFVGRREQLKKLHEHLGVGAIGVVTAVHGLGGIGKTELVYHYANGWADCYPTGLWSLAAEGKKELIPLLGELAFVPQFSYTPNESEKADPQRLGHAVLAELKERHYAFRDPEHPYESAPALIILDNVSQHELLAADQLAQLPHPANWLRIVATTRLDPSGFARSHQQVVTVAVDALDEDDSLQLIRDHQLGGSFATPDEESAGREIVRELGGFTLAVEQVAIHLSLYADVESPNTYLLRLKQQGLSSVDELAKDSSVATQMLHREKLLKPILDATVAGIVNKTPDAWLALQYAALLPPDTVPWSWLRHFVGLADTSISDSGMRWSRLKRLLLGSRLLTMGGSSETARMHRLVRDFIVSSFAQHALEPLEVRIRNFISDTLTHVETRRLRLTNEVMTGNPDEAVTAWNVPDVSVVIERARENGKVDVLVHGDGSYTIAVKDDAFWELEAIRMFATSQVLGHSVRGIDWALRTKQVPDQVILEHRSRFVTDENTPVREGAQEATIAGLYLLREASAWCRRGLDRRPYQLAQSAVALFRSLAEEYPESDNFHVLLSDAREAEEMYGWF